MGQPIVELTNDDIGFYSIRCGTWQLRESQTPAQPATEFFDGSHLVNIDIAPGTYVTNSGDEDCNWFRTAPFGDRNPDNTGGYVSEGHQTISLLPTDTGFYSQGCGTWRLLSELDLTSEPADTIGQGTFVVGTDIQPGAYVADANPGRLCRWFHLSGFAGRATDVTSSGNGLLRGITEISPNTRGFRSIDCGEWKLIEHTHLQEGPTTNFGDGEHIVNVHLPPGIYSSPGPETGRCSWRRLGGFTGTASDHIAVRNPVGKNIAQILESDAVFISFGCGEWRPFGTETDTPLSTRFVRGTWGVNSEIEPGTYVAEVPLGSICFWSRLAGFSGEPADFTVSDSAIGRSITTIRDYDAGFYSDGCGVWNIVAEETLDAPGDLLTVFDDGVYLAGRDIAAGTYLADGLEDEICYWSRLTGFNGDDFNRINLYASPGQAMATITDTDIGFRSFGCGTWRSISQPGEIASVQITEQPRSDFGDGTYRVGVDIISGIYMTDEGSQTTCKWRRLSDFTWTGGVTVESLVSGRKFVEIDENDLGFASSNCGHWSLIDLDSLQQDGTTPTRFASGSYLVGVHIDPGTYVANPRPGGGCRWQRVSSFTGDASDTISSGFSNDRWIVTIEEDDLGFVTHGCGIWRSVESSLLLGPYEEFPDGSYLANVDLVPGTYVADVAISSFIDGKPTPNCRWQRVTGFGHTSENQLAIGIGKGRIVATVKEDDVGFVSSGCGTWRMLH